MSLLDKAKGYQSQRITRTPIDQELIELAIAWVKNEVNNVQFHHALGTQVGADVYVKVAQALKYAYTNGLIDIKVK